MTNEEIVRNACEIVWTRGEIDRMGEFYAQDFHADYPGTDWGEGLPGAMALAREIRKAFPDYREQIEELIAAREHVVVRLRIRGSHTGVFGGVAATGRKVEFRDVTVCRLHGGKIVEQWGLSDRLTLLSQLGLVSIPAS